MKQRETAPTGSLLDFQPAALWTIIIDNLKIVNYNSILKAYGLSTDPFVMHFSLCGTSTVFEDARGTAKAVLCKNNEIEKNLEES